MPWATRSLQRVERLAHAGEMILDVVEDAEVRQREARRRAALRLPERLLPGLQVDVGRGRRREDEACGRDPDAHGVAGVQRSVLVQHRHVVARMPGAREALEPDDAVADDPDVRLGDGNELAPERVERVAVEAARARLEPSRIDEVRRADGERRGRGAWGAHGRARLPRRRGRSGCERGGDGGSRRARGRARRGPPSVPAGRSSGPQSKRREAVVGLDEIAADAAPVALVQKIDRCG